MTSPDASAVPRRLSAELLDISQDLAHKHISLRDLMDRLEGRVYTLLLVLLTLPFCQPVALPGLSTPFGVVIALLGMRFAVRQKPWLPRRLLDTPIPPKFLPSVLRAGGKFLGYLERILHPRGVWIFEYRATQFLSGSIIFICGLLLLLPLPIPFSNLLPALAVILVAVAMSERDGVVLVVGGCVFLMTLGFFVGIFFGGTAVIGWVNEHFRGIFEPKD